MTVRIHLFPSRTQKLSSLVPKILGWKRPGKIGKCRHTRGSHGGTANPYSSLAQSVEHAAVNRRVVRSSRTGGAKAPPSILSAALFTRVFSSVGQSPRLITGWSRVRVPEDPPNRKDACWRLFYLVGLGERRPFTDFPVAALI